MIVKTEIDCEVSLLEVNLDDNDGEPFLDGVWDMYGNEIDLDKLPEVDQERVLIDSIQEAVDRRSDWAAHVAEDWTGS
jgi:hypothetical protein